MLMSTLDGLSMIQLFWTIIRMVYCLLLSAPSAEDVGEFSCRISTAMVGYTSMTFKLPKVKRVRRLRLETPEKDFILVPSYFLREREAALKLRICVRKLIQDAESQ